MDVGIHGYRYGNAALQRQGSQSRAGTADGGFLAEMLKTQAAGDGLKGVYDRLTPGSQKALEGLKAGRNGMSKEQWNTLCRELKDLGAITQAQLDYSRADLRLAPLVSDGRGGVTAPTIVKKFLKGGHLDGGAWKGDPLAYLDEWIEVLRESRSELSVQCWPDGEKKYKDLSPLTNQINGCGKVADILRELLAL